MSTRILSRLVTAGWSINCERYIEIDMRDEVKNEQRFCTWRATKATDEVVVKAKLGREEAALLDMYQTIKTIDPDLRHIAAEEGSGVWVIDSNDAEAKPNRSE